MTTPARPADTAGNRYEHWWALSECVRLLQGATETLRIETLGAGRAELIVTAAAHRERHLVRDGHASGTWSLAALEAGDDHLLQTAGDRLAGNDDRLVFASGSRAPELAALCAAALEAESVEAFERNLPDRQSRAGLARLRRCWICDAPAAFERLQRIDVHTASEREIQRRVHWGLQALFMAAATRVGRELLAILIGSVQHTLTRRQLVERLARRGRRPRRLYDPNHAGGAVEAATDRYLEGARRGLVRGAMIRREAAAKLRARLEGPASESVLTGRAGAGKTACVVAVVESLRARGMPVLAFRIDYLVSATTTQDLGRGLALEESPVLVLAEAAHAAGSPAVLVVDQLDASGHPAGGGCDPCSLVERLVHEARGARARATLHTVIVCRSSDWRHDPRLRRLLPATEAQIEVPALARREVEQVLRDAGFDPARFRARQLEILQLPQHLALFLEGGAETSSAPAFATATALFDGYWSAKRRRVAERAAPLPDQWMTAVSALCDEMISTRQPTAQRERLDEVSPAYLERLAAENVITADGRRCAFGHETLFDYCAARVSFNRRESLVRLLTGSEQHLSGRLRIRQTLAYLRNADPASFIRELGELLEDKAVRPHVKDLAFAVLADAPDPTEQEWMLWKRWLAPALQATEAGTPNPDRLSALAWRRFVESPTWFEFADRRGIVEGWLAADNDRLAAAAVRYLLPHGGHAPDLVAALLEPYADVGGEWTARLRYFMERAGHHASRRLFDLFLRLIDNGTLDDARARDTAAGTFWGMLAGLGEQRPEWVPEVLAHRLRRRLEIIRTAGEDAGSRESPGYDDAAAGLFRRSAESAPAAFVEHVLAPVLDISDAMLTGSRPPKHDAVWPVVARTAYPEVDHACLEGLSAALAALARNVDAELRETVAGLRGRDTHVANHLLLALYRGGAGRHADEAAILLCDEPWRLQCGFSDSPQWHAAATIRAVAPHCAPENRERLEGLLLEYAAPDERGLRGYRRAGRARFTLLAAIPADLRSTRADAEIRALAGRFGQPDGDPREIAVDAVESPIGEAADAMSDEQWLGAVAGHRSGAGVPASPDELRESTWELARRLEARTAEDPDRFARLALKLPAGTHPVYVERTLAALATAAVESELTLQVCHKAFVESRGPCGRAVAAALGGIVDPLPNDAVRMLHWLATEHEDPVTTAWQAEDLGIDTARGSAADAVRRLIARDAGYVRRFRVTIERLIHDPSASVRACAAETLRAVADHDPALGTKLFQAMDLSEDHLLAAPEVYRFIRDRLRDRFAEVRPFVERMLLSPEPEVCEAGARLASLAALEHAGAADLPVSAAPPAAAAMSARPGDRSAADLAAEAGRGGPAHRLGIAQVAAANLAIPEYRAWSARTLAALFDDDDAGVRRQAASGCRHLADGPLAPHAELIEAFCASKAFAEHPASILEVLEASDELLPGAACTVCEKFLDRFTEEARDARSPRHADAHTVATLAFRICRQQRDGDLAARGLDLIDRLCLDAIGDARGALEQFER